MPRLPEPGSDQGTWGQILNDYLAETHAPDGTLKANVVTSTQLANNSVTSAQIAPGSVTVTEVQDGQITEAKLATAVRTKLNTTGTGAVSSVAGKTGAVSLVKADIGLDNVDNTSDSNKPISAATQAALDNKVSSSALATVATSGDYTDLTNRPSIPTVTGTNTGDQTLSISGNSLSISGTNGNTISIPSTGAGSPPRIGIIRVASNQAPEAVKSQCDYVCDGVDDQDQINAALARASRSGDNLGGESLGCVELVGGDFMIGQNGNSITMYPATWLKGSGWSTMVQPRFASDLDQGAIELYDASSAQVRVSDLSIGRPNSVLSNGHAIKFIQSGVAATREIQTGNDPFISLHNILILKTSRDGVQLSGVSGGARETHIENVHVWDVRGHGFNLSSSDCKLANCTANPGGTGHGFYLASGNLKLINCKSYYSEADTDGFHIASARAELTACAAQDNGRWGFNFTSGTDVTATSLVADSNARLTATGGGFRIAIGGVYDGLHAFDRGQTPASPQMNNYVIVGTPNIYLTGRSKPIAGGTHVTGNPDANSFVRIVQQGSSPFTVN